MTSDDQTTPATVGTNFDVSAETQLLKRLRHAWATTRIDQHRRLTRTEISELQALERQLRQQGRWISGPTTILEVLGVETDEVRNCRIVRWLFDPLAPHGLGAVALGEFLRCVSLRAGEQGIETPTFDDLESARVRVEEARAHTRADIVIETTSWTVVVEAKINAAEQPRQGERITDLWPGSTFVFLTRRGHQMRTAGDEPWVALRWSELLSAVSDAATAHPPADTSSPAVLRARRAVDDYLEGTRRLAR